MNDFLTSLPFIGLDLGTGTRGIDLNKEFAKTVKKSSQKIPQTVSELAELEGLTQKGALSTIDTTGLTPILPSGMDAEVDPITGRLVGKDRPTALIPTVGAKVLDFLSAGISDLDRQGGGIFGRATENKKTGLGGKPTDFYLSKAQKDAIKDRLTPTSSSSGAIPDAEGMLDFYDQNADRIRSINKKLGRGAALDEAANYALTEPIRQAFLNKAAQDAQDRFISGKFQLEALPGKIQERVGQAALTTGNLRNSMSNAADAATRMASVGLGRAFGQPYYRV